jgi:UDP-N-acetylglucosamine--N-acetylmuramyl-(pentapeptide) pyrophosphoryl-undecaprenol N-acetylglucosamine transferase
MRVIFAGGGTGGHLFPGLAVAREFQRRDVRTEILFVGTEQGIEFRVLPKEGFKLETLTVKGIKGRGVRGIMDALYGVPASFVRSLAIIRRFRPDCIIGLGGYASGPLLLAGRVTGVCCAIMEQNLRPGFTNKILARLVQRVFTSYPQSAEFFRGARLVETGNPVRWQKLPEIKKRNKFSLLVFGGSAGARRINFAVVDALKELTDLKAELFLMHQTGQADHAAIKEAYAALPFEAEVTPFIDRMDEAYAGADLVLCRAGATTLAELTAFGKAALLVPYPYAIYDHQRDNAQALQERGAAEMILDQELSGRVLAARIRT